MHHHYTDILSRIKEPPLWFDEQAVPRFDPFSPRETANIYAREVVLFHIKCQSCERDFHVCMSWGTYEMAMNVPSLEERVKTGSLHYGDPPNMECCPAGNTENSVPVKVLEFWKRESFKDVRVPELEREIRADWWEYEPAESSK